MQTIARCTEALYPREGDDETRLHPAPFPLSPHRQLYQNGANFPLETVLSCPNTQFNLCFPTLEEWGVLPRLAHQGQLNIYLSFYIEAKNELRSLGGGLSGLLGISSYAAAVSCNASTGLGFCSSSSLPTTRAPITIASICRWSNHLRKNRRIATDHGTYHTHECNIVDVLRSRSTLPANRPNTFIPPAKEGKKGIRKTGVFLATAVKTGIPLKKNNPFLITRFSFGLLSPSVTTDRIFEIS